MNSSNNALWPNFIDYSLKGKIDRSFSTHYLVIGAGITGLCAAHTLSELDSDAKITIVDKDNAFNNASNNNAGFAMRISRILGASHQNNLSVFNRTNRINEYGFNRLKTLVLDSIDDEYWQEIGLIHAGNGEVARQNDVQYQKCLSEANILYQEWNEALCHKMLGSEFYRHAVYVPKGCALVQPAALTKVLLDKLLQNCDVFYDSKVSKIDPNGDAEINGHRIKCDKIILATNYHKIQGLNFSHRAFGLTLAGSITKVLDDDALDSLGELKQWGILSSHPLGATVRLTPDRRLMLRNSICYNKNKPLNAKQLNLAQQHHLKALKLRFPRLKLEIERSWTAIEGRTFNETSYFNKLNDKVYLCGVYNGSGITKGAALGSHIAYLATNKDAPLMGDIVNHFPKAKYIPQNKWLLNIGINTRLKWIRRDLGSE